MTGGFRQVGEFPAPRQPIIRSLRNPIDKSTIASIFPKEIHERKFTIEPGVFNIGAGSLEQPALLTVGGSSWWKSFDEDQPVLEIPVSSVAVAESVIKDYCNGMLGCDMSGAMPGLFLVLGEVSSLELKMKYAAKIEEVKIKQDNWFKILVRIADSLWARSNGNPLTISDEMRLGAKMLNMNDKEWLLDFNIVEMVKCIACGSLKNPLYPVCPQCHNVDMTNPRAKDLKFVTG